MALIHSVDSISEKNDKHVEHGTPIIRLVPPDTRRRLQELAKEDS